MNQTVDTKTINIERFKVVEKNHVLKVDGKVKPALSQRDSTP